MDVTIKKEIARTMMATWLLNMHQQLDEMANELLTNTAWEETLGLENADYICKRIKAAAEELNLMCNI